MGDHPIIEAGRRFDPDATWAPLDERIARESDPQTRQLLEQVRQHMKVEIGGDHGALMATLVDEPRYHFWGTDLMEAPKSRAAVAAFYEQMIDGGGNRFEFRIHKIVADRENVVTEGTMRQKLPGAAIAVSGIQEVDGEAVDPSAEYLCESQILTVWPGGEGGRLVGEDIYFGTPIMAHVTRL